jgi:AI-2E family transporter
VVGTVDNVLRPYFVGKDAEIPDLLILTSTLGGLFLFGPIGFIIGPLVCGMFLTALDIYGTAFKNVLPPVKSLAADAMFKPEPITRDKPAQRATSRSSKARSKESDKTTQG